MSRGEMTILTNMCMIEDGSGNVLVQDRSDPGWPGIVFPGGHVEPGESFIESVIREVREETGLTVIAPKLCGVKHFTTRDGVRYVVFLFRANRYEGELCPSEEGNVFWVPRCKLPDERCVENFDHMLKIFEEDSISELYYRGGEVSFL